MIHVQSIRPVASVPNIDTQEVAWWNKYAEIENKFCWVQTPEIQRLIRRHYVRRIITAVPTGGVVAELGCGTGWLCILLAKLGASRVNGIDISESQVRHARESSVVAGVSDKVDFKVLSTSDMQSDACRYDVVVVHAFLHHLTKQEIDQVLQTAKEMMKPHGRLCVLEPVINSNPNKSILSAGLFRLLNTFKKIPSRGQNVRFVSVAESVARKAIMDRNVGRQPHGPSPKEMPFVEGELEEHLEKHFNIDSRSKVLIGSHQVAQELLLLEESYPRFCGIIKKPFLIMTHAIEWLLLKCDSMPTGEWVFELFECRCRDGAKTD